MEGNTLDTNTNSPQHSAEAPNHASPNHPPETPSAARSSTGLIDRDLYIFHGTSSAFDSIRLPGEAGFVSEVGQANGAAFYTFATDDPALLDVIRSNARVYADNGLLLGGVARAGEVRMIDAQAALGDNLADQFRTQLRATTGTDPLLNRYFQHVAETLTGTETGASLWARLSTPSHIQPWLEREAVNRLGENPASTLRADRARLNASLEGQGLGVLADLDDMTPEQRSTLSGALRQLQPEHPGYGMYYEQLAQRVESGNIKSGIEIVRETSTDRTLLTAVRTASVQGIELPSLASMDALWIETIGSMDIAGISYNTDGARTALFQGEAGMRQLPALRIEEMHGSSPNDMRADRARALQVGDIMLPEGGGRAATTLENPRVADSVRAGELRWTTGRRDGAIYTDVFIEPGMDADRIVADLARDGVPASRTTMTYPSNPDMPLEVVRVDLHGPDGTNNFSRLQTLGANLDPIIPPASIDAQLGPAAERTTVIAEPDGVVDRRAPDSPMRASQAPAVPDRAPAFPAPDQFGRSTVPRNGLSTDPLVYTQPSWMEGHERLPPLDMDGLQSQLRREGAAALEASGLQRTPPQEFGRRGVGDARTQLITTDSVRTVAVEPAVRPAPLAANDGDIGIVRSERIPPVMPDAPELPRGRTITGGRALGAATVVLTAGMPIIEGLMTQRTDAGETRGEAIGRAYRNAPENLVRSVAAPIVSLTEGDGTMAAAQTLQLATMIDAPGWVQLMRADAVARGIPQADVDRFSTDLPAGNMNLGSRDAALNQIAQLIAYREQGVEHLIVGTNMFSAGVKVYGPGAPGMAMAEGTWVTSTDALLNEQVRLYMANGGTATAIMEATDPQFYREQVYNRLRNTVPDNSTPGYTHYPMEAREGMQLLEQFRAGIQAGNDATPEGRAALINVANEYLRARDFDETDALRNANYQYSRLSFTIPRPEQFVAAGMGGVFGVTGRPEDLAADMANIGRVLNTAVGTDQTILSRIRIGSDFSASTQDVFAALPPEMQTQVTAESARLAAIAPPVPTAVPAPVVVPPAPPAEEAPAETIVVTGERYPDARSDDQISGRLSRIIQEGGLTGFIDRDGGGTIEFGELRAKLRDAGVTIADNGRVSTDQLQQALPALQAMRDESASRG